MTKTYNITGMKCQGCVNTVTEKLSAVKGVDKVQVDLENKQVTIEGKPWKWSLKRALKGTKFALGDEISDRHEIDISRESKSSLFFYFLEPDLKKLDICNSLSLLNS